MGPPQAADAGPTRNTPFPQYQPPPPPPPPSTEPQPQPSQFAPPGVPLVHVVPVFTAPVMQPPVYVQPVVFVPPTGPFHAFYDDPNDPLMEAAS